MAPYEEEPTPDEWRELHAAAVAFRDLKPWEWMGDADVFGVISPEDGQVGYCSVSGEEGDHHALTVHRGARGFFGYLAALHEGFDDELTYLVEQDHLSASFEDRATLDRRDLSVIRALGLRFRGRMNWPWFRSLRPGYFPWYVTGGEARSLAVALRQAAVVSQQAKEDPSGLWDGRDRFLHRVPDGDGWRDELRRDPGPPTPTRGVLPDPASARAVVVAAGRLPGERWEVDVLPARARGETRQGHPYAVHVIVWISQGPRGFIRYETVEPADVPRLVPSMTLSTIKLVGAPEAVLVPSEEVRALLEPLLGGTGVGLEVVPRLPGVKRVRAILNEMVGGARPVIGARPK